MTYATITTHRIENTNLGSRALFYAKGKFQFAGKWHENQEQVEQAVAKYQPNSKLEFIV